MVQAAHQGDLANKGVALRWADGLIAYHQLFKWSYKVSAGHQPYVRYRAYRRYEVLREDGQRQKSGSSHLSSQAKMLTLQIAVSRTFEYGWYLPVMH